MKFMWRGGLHSLIKIGTRLRYSNGKDIASRKSKTYSMMMERIHNNSYKVNLNTNGVSKDMKMMSFFNRKAFLRVSKDNKRNLSNQRKGRLTKLGVIQKCGAPSCQMQNSGIFK